jgi:hypothetical protein
VVQTGRPEKIPKTPDLDNASVGKKRKRMKGVLVNTNAPLSFESKSASQQVSRSERQFDLRIVFSLLISDELFFG